MQTLPRQLNRGNMDCQTIKLEMSAAELQWWRQYYAGIKHLAVYRDDPETAYFAEELITDITLELDKRGA